MYQLPLLHCSLILSNDGNSHVFSKSFKIPLSCSSLQLSSGSLNIEAILTTKYFPQNCDHVIDGAKQGSAKQIYCMYVYVYKTNLLVKQNSHCCFWFACGILVLHGRGLFCRIGTIFLIFGDRIKLCKTNYYESKGIHCMTGDIFKPESIKLQKMERWKCDANKKISCRTTCAAYAFGVNH